MIIHVVKYSETLYNIAKKYNTTIDNIANSNGISPTSSLAIGQSLIITNQNTTYVVKANDSLYSISLKYNISVDTLINSNPNINPNKLAVGQKIIINYTGGNKKNISLNGYAYANVDVEILKKSLPYLTYLSIFSYEIRADGTIKKIDDTKLIQLAYEYRVAPLLVITNIDANGGFSSGIASSILNSEQFSNKLIQDLFDIVVKKGYYGIDVDFEYIYEADKVAYVNFLAKLKNLFSTKNLIVTSAVAPKLSSTQSGTLYSGHDYKTIGSAIDLVTLMTYEWGNTYSDPMPVAPINQVGKVIDYGITEIPRNKILMGVPNYGYAFYFPTNKNQPASTISNSFALERAINVGATIFFDELTKTPYYSYYEPSGQKRVVFFEDARSLEAKINLVINKNIEGISLWTIMRYFQPIYTLLTQMVNIKKVIK